MGRSARAAPGEAGAPRIDCAHGDPRRCQDERDDRREFPLA